jgi:hypothetical protein
VVDDAYAINAPSDEEIWLYFYSNFPIVRISGGSYRVWSFGIGGAGALAIRNGRALLFGDYQAPALARIVELRDDGTASVLEELAVVDSTGMPMKADKVLGVGSKLFFFQGRQVLAIEGW